ncbi:MAG TPA: cell division protein FtsQ/DivIB [Rugosibacter sp.]|nr:cell division protein FtsQ/DivIB [Rugosibacter sp.]HPB90166.1 cell division protein FtsQ/DivIB [Rugosibacter sp.]HQN47127.1 cell division protein FtsQ/DivIB [Rugosibacter sp.]HQQ34953.1 cell division protein FtsQ/DivIB [Rugosibacter sp.]
MINKNERMGRRLFNAAPDQSVKSSLSSRGAGRGASKSVAKTATEGNLFWNSIWLLEIAANALFVIGAALLLWSAMLILQRLPILPIKTLVVSAPVAHVSSAQLEQVVRTTIKGGFLTVNLAEAQHAFEQLPWVRRANLRRQWPDRLVLTLEGQRAVAQWTPLDGEMRLVNDLGEVFAIDVPIRVALPVFAGPEGTSAEMLVRYGEFAAHLAEVNQDLVGVRLSSREAWQLTLADGVVIELGREQAKASLAERVARFVTYYPRVKNELQAERSVEVVDMRYPNGFAMKARKS